MKLYCGILLGFEDLVVVGLMSYICCSQLLTTQQKLICIIKCAHMHALDYPQSSLVGLVVVRLMSC